MCCPAYALKLQGPRFGGPLFTVTSEYYRHNTSHDDNDRANIDTGPLCDIAV